MLQFTAYSKKFAKSRRSFIFIVKDKPLVTTSQHNKFINKLDNKAKIMYNYV